MNSKNDLDTPIWEAEAIAKVLGRTTRQTYHLLENGHIDASRIGNRWVSTPRRLLQHIVGRRVAWAESETSRS